MSLEIKKYTFEDADTHDYVNVEFIPCVVSDKEVYSIEATITDHNSKKESEKCHYGYMTKKMVAKLEKDNCKALKKLKLTSPLRYPNEVTSLNQRIIIDYNPIGEDEKLDIGLKPIVYSKILEPTVTIGINKFFLIFTTDTPLIFKFNKNKLNCDSFFVIDNNKIGTTTIDLNVDENRAGVVSLNNIQPTKESSGDAYLSLSVGKDAKIDLMTFIVPGLVGDKKNKPLKIYAKDGIKAFSSTLRYENYNSSVGGEIKVDGKLDLNMSNLIFYNSYIKKGPSLSVSGDCTIDNADCQICEDNYFKGSLGLLKCKKTQSQRAKIMLSKAGIKSPLEMQPFESGEISLIINDSAIENGKKKVFLRGNKNLFYKSYISNDGVEGLQIKDSSFYNSYTENSKIFTNTHLRDVDMRNCTIENEGNGSINIGSLDDSGSFEDRSTAPIAPRNIYFRGSRFALKDEESVDFKTNGEVSADNVSINGSFSFKQKLKSKEDSPELVVVLENSIFNNADISLKKDEEGETTIKRSEINGVFNATGLLEIFDSFIENSTISGVKRIESSSIKDFDFHGSKEIIKGAGITNIDIDAVDEKSQATNDLEFL